MSSSQPYDSSSNGGSTSGTPPSFKESSHSSGDTAGSSLASSSKPSKDGETTPTMRSTYLLPSMPGSSTGRDKSNTLVTLATPTIPGLNFDVTSEILKTIGKTSETDRQRDFASLSLVNRKFRAFLWPKEFFRRWTIARNPRRSSYRVHCDTGSSDVRSFVKHLVVSNYGPNTDRSLREDFPPVPFAATLETLAVESPFSKEIGTHEETQSYFGDIFENAKGLRAVCLPYSDNEDTAQGWTEAMKRSKNLSELRLHRVRPLPAHHELCFPKPWGKGGPFKEGGRWSLTVDFEVNSAASSEDVKRASRAMLDETYEALRDSPDSRLCLTYSGHGAPENFYERYTVGYLNLILSHKLLAKGSSRSAEDIKGQITFRHNPTPWWEDECPCCQPWRPPQPRTKQDASESFWVDEQPNSQTPA
ncbi:hypothetical protein BCR39DRAFT_558485 [Naematelia encephala]|uniref:Uncharacterized protein n=1 Tax=Naematelia encephala TaxID=71784 RepID=A0A1Y2B7I9_9TREE|nr:hypothetical protein BCR39DRAFT_558485 [Naematelia encephala]